MARSSARPIPVVLLLAGGLACAGGSPDLPWAAPPPGAAEAGVPADPGPAAEAPPTEAKYAATQVLVAWAGAAGAPQAITRTPAEARARAAEVWRRAAAGEPLEDLARAMSDAPSAPRGGGIGVYRPGTLVPTLEQAVAALRVGEVSRPFETPYGWHVVRRDAVREIEARHVLVTWKGAWRSGATRTRDEARARIDQVVVRLEAGEDFATVARTSSDDPSATAGGALGVVAPGQLIPAFEEAAFALDVGARSAVVETPYGFHVIERTR